MNKMSDLDDLFGLFQGSNSTSLLGAKDESLRPCLQNPTSPSPTSPAVKRDGQSCVVQQPPERTSKGRASDSDLKDRVINERLCDVVVDCSNARCPYGNGCQDNPGFFRWMVAERNRFWGSRGAPAPTTKERSEKIRKILEKAHKGGHSFEFSYITNFKGEEINVKICQHAFIGALLGGNKTNQWFNVMHEFSSPKKFVVDRKREDGGRRMAAKEDQVKAWIKFFLEACDDPAGKGLGGKKFLPFPNIAHFYYEYERSFRPTALAMLMNMDDKSTQNPASLSTFRRVFEKYFEGSVSMMKDIGNHTGCDVCINGAVILSDLGRMFPPAAQDAIMEFKSLHIKQQWAERDDCTLREIKAQNIYDKVTGNPSYFYICCDYVSTWTGDTPRFNGVGRKTKSDESRETIKTKMCGARTICGRIFETMVFYIDNMTTSGANVMIEIIRRTLFELSKELATSGLKLPRNGFFEFDNCGADNKNYALFCYFQMLVDLEYFDSIRVNYLITGHTHNPIDQTVGTYSTVTHDVTFVASPMALKALLQSHQGDGYMAPRVFQHIDVVYDFAAATKPYVNKKLSNLFTCHNYLFERHEALGRAHLLYSMFHDQPLQPEQHVLAACQTGHPEAVFATTLDIGDEFAFCGGKEKLFRHLGIDKPTSKLTATDTERLSAIALLETQGVFKDYHKENCQRIGESNRKERYARLFH
jgi:hypothetical protein